MTFTGSAHFPGTTCTGTAWFDRTTFAEHAEFTGAQFSDAAWFDRTNFAGDTLFDQASFTGPAGFRRVAFDATASFDGTGFGSETVDFSATRRWVPPGPAFDWAADGAGRPANIEPQDWPPPRRSGGVWLGQRIPASFIGDWSHRPVGG
ncbi:pentapeptide repeat-containing protein [Nocardia sp. NPDC050799]|uniref:pentapeptide repeat-containing protein n=1 Tax=Nocardia sp. NPDC050799 TaxID=3154842 RepID=UPI0033C42318